jgi:hypothetical protein
LNPVENIWEEIREKNFHNQVFASLDILETHLLQAMKDLEETPDTTKSIASWPWIINAILT